MGQGGGVSVYRERLSPPPTWWIIGGVFASACGWIVLVATSWPMAIGAGVIVGAAAAAALWHYGVVVQTGPREIRAGRARVDATYVRAVESLDPGAWQTALGPAADARQWLVTRPYVDRGLRILLDDPHDPTPAWLVSSRRPEAHRRAFVGSTPTNGDDGGQQEER